MSYKKYENWKRNRLQGLPELSVVINTHNDQTHILHIIDRIASFMCGLRYEWELIVCDSRSSDKTIQLIKDLKYANLTILDAESPYAAVQKGMLAARGGLVLYENIHDSTPIEEAKRLLPRLEGEFDIAIGSRQDPPAKRSRLQTLGRNLLAELRRRFLSLFLKNSIQDPDSGFRLYSGRLVARLFTNLKDKTISPNLEALYLAGRLGYRVTEVPVGWVRKGTKNPDGRKTVAQLLPGLLRLSWNDFMGRYKEI